MKELSHYEGHNTYGDIPLNLFFFDTKEQQMLVSYM